jgi:hypothetical protein
MPYVTRRLAALAAAVLVVAGCASPYPPAVAPVASVAAPRLEDGERWVYEQINPYNDLRVRALTDTVEKGPHGYRVVRRSDRPGDPLEVKILSRPWSLAAETSAAALQEYDPPLTVIPFPIAPGTHWLETLRSVNERGEVRRQQTWGRALDWERVTTPAGEFVALRIERARNLGDHNVFWDDTYTFETLWYAPAVKRWVRREWRSRRQELGLDPRVAIDARMWQLLSYRK